MKFEGFCLLLISATVFAQESSEDGFVVSNEQPSQTSVRSPAASFDTLSEASTRDILARGHVFLSTYLDSELLLDYRPLAWNGTPTNNGIIGALNYMIDGVSITNPEDYGFAATIGAFPEEFSKVELIRGPAGVTWGSFSLLGSVNLLSGDATDVAGQSANFALGAPGLGRFTYQGSTRVADGLLRTFIGYASQHEHTPSMKRETILAAPYGGTWKTAEVPGTGSAEPDRALVASISYKRGPWSAYARLPFIASSYSVSSLGSLVASGEAAKREQFFGFGYLTYRRAWLDGRVSALGQLSYYRATSQAEHQLLAPSQDLPDGAAYRLASDLGRSEAVGEIAIRWPTEWATLETLMGGTAQFEQVYSSNFASGTIIDGERVWVDGGDAYRRQNVGTGALYVFQRMSLWERLALGLGSRHYFGGVSFRDITLFQVNTGLRVVGATHIKASYYQGMRPPQLPDRQGVRPVNGERLQPETSDSIQVEVSTALADTALVQAANFSVVLARTTTQNDILRSSQTFAPYRQFPTNNSGGNVINSIYLSGDAKLDGFPLRLRVGYRFNQVTDSRAAGNDQDRIKAIEENPACGVEVCANRGPAHRYLIGTDVTIKDLAFVDASTVIDCGGTWRTATPRAVQNIPYVYDRADIQPEGCYVRPSIAVGFPAVPGPWNVRLSARNLTNVKRPPMLYNIPELSNAEAPVYVVEGRTVIATLTYTLGANETW